MTVFSTAAALLLRDRDAEVDAVVAQVAQSFRVEVEEVAGRDWLREVANRDAPDDRWRAAADIASVSSPPLLVAVPPHAGAAETRHGPEHAREPPQPAGASHMPGRGVA